MKYNHQGQPIPRLKFPPKLLSYEIATLYQQGKRKDQQDSLLTVNADDVTMMRRQGVLLAVADGMGGMAGGKQAGQIVVHSLEEDFAHVDLRKNLGSQLSEMAKRANENVYRFLLGKGGSTLVAGDIYNERFSWVSVGDSYIFLKRGDSVYRINQDMNVRIRCYREMLAENSLDTSYGNTNPEAAALWTFIGMEQMNREPEYSRISLRLENQDRLLLCSDGVGGVMTDQEILTAMSRERADDICEALYSCIKNKNLKNQDNYTAVVVRCSY